MSIRTPLREVIRAPRAVIEAQKVQATARPLPAPRFTEQEKSRLQKAITLAIVVLPFVALPLAVQQLWGRLVNWTDLALLVGLYIPIALGITVGFHRMLTHKSFETNRVVKFALLALGSMAVEGQCIGWAADHTLHHLLSDQKGDPHSPTEGLWHSHVGWLFSGRQADPKVYVSALLRDPIVVFMDRTFIFWVAVGLWIPFAIGGWEGLIWGGLIRMGLVHHVTWSVNSICHTFGSRPYATADESRNNWVVGLLAFGEGQHNSHHRWPKSAIHGMDRWQFDLSAWLIQGLQKVGLATDVVTISADTRRRERARAVSGASFSEFGTEHLPPRFQ